MNFLFILGGINIKFGDMIGFVPQLLLAGIFIILPLLAVVKYITLLKKVKICTLEVDATIIKLRGRLERRKIYYLPIYEYYYDDKRYVYKSIKKRYDENAESNLGFNEIILINPDKPSQAFDKGEVEAAKEKVFIYGLFFISFVVAVIMCYTFI